jgi:Lipocalin-like domain
MKIHIKLLFAVLFAAGTLLIVSCHKQAIDPAMLSGRWVELQSVNQHGSMSNGVTTWSASIDTARPIDTLLFPTASRFIEIHADTVQGAFSDTGTYTISGNTINMTYPNNTTYQVEVLSLTSQQLVVKITQIATYLYVDPIPVTVNTITYAHR